MLVKPVRQTLSWTSVYSGNYFFRPVLRYCSILCQQESTGKITFIINTLYLLCRCIYERRKMCCHFHKTSFFILKWVKIYMLIYKLLYICFILNKMLPNTHCWYFTEAHFIFCYIILLKYYILYVKMDTICIVGHICHEKTPTSPCVDYKLFI